VSRKAQSYSFSSSGAFLCGPCSMKFLVPIHASGLHSPTETPPLLLEQVKPVSQWVVADADTTGGRALLREAMRRLLEPGCMSRISLLLNPQQAGLTQVCVNLTQVCVNLTQACANLTQACVNLTQAGGSLWLSRTSRLVLASLTLPTRRHKLPRFLARVCVTLTQVCVNLTQVCVNLTQACVNSLSSWRLRSPAGCPRTTTTTTRSSRRACVRWRRRKGCRQVISRTHVLIQLTRGFRDP
jgi:hypothetical protein